MTKKEERVIREIKDKYVGYPEDEEVESETDED